MAKKLLCLAIAIILLFAITACLGSGPKDKKVIGTWTSDYYGTFELKANGRYLMSGSVLSYEAEDGVLKVSYGKFGDEYYNYEITYGVTSDGESVTMLSLWQDRDFASDKKTYFKK